MTQRRSSYRDDTATVLELLRSGSPLIGSDVVQSLPKAARSRAESIAAALLMAAEDTAFRLSPYFDAGWYKFQIVANERPDTYFGLVRHYVLSGENVGLSPHPFLPISAIERRMGGEGAVPRYSGGFGTKLEYIIKNVDWHFSRSCLFDSDFYYIQQHGSFAAGSRRQDDVRSLFVRFLSDGVAGVIAPNPLFHEEWYVSRHADVRSSIDDGKYPNGFAHFIDVGESQGRSSSPYFGAEYYTETNPDVAGAIKQKELTSGFWHYWNNGLREGRVGGEQAVPVAMNFNRSPPAERWFTNGRDVYAGKRRDALEVSCTAAILDGCDASLEMRQATYFRFAEPHIQFDSFEQPIMHEGGTYTLFLSGVAMLPYAELTSVFAAIGSWEAQVKFFRVPRIDPRIAASDLLRQAVGLDIGLFVIIEIERLNLAVGRHDLILSFNFSSRLGDRETVGPKLAIDVDHAPVRSNQTGSCQVLLASYNPRIDAFSAQVRSIVQQNVADVSLIVQDDNSPKTALSDLYRVVIGERRTSLTTNGRNVNFVGNFERCLLSSSPHVSYLAFSDQDDVWHGKKLPTLMSACARPGVTCVFSDMRIVDQDGECISDTFWDTRSVHFSNTVGLACANTVTGAASLFPAGMRDILLPFPRFPGLYHDQWLAVAASACGEVSYVDEPLYDYVQHGSNVLGFAGSRSFETFKFRACSSIVRRLRKKTPDLWTDFECDVFEWSLQDSLGSLLQRFVLLYSVVKRVEAWRDAREQAFAVSFVDLLLGAPVRPARVFNYLRTVRSSSGRDRGLIGVDYRLEAATFALLISRAQPSAVSARMLQRLAARRRSEKTFVKHWTSKESTDFERKIQPIQLRKVADSPDVRLTMFIPELRLATFFGGYFSKIAFLSRLQENGFDVRVVLLDQADVQGIEILDIANSFPELARCLLSVEIVCLGGREKPLDVRRQDVLIATTWWSAHVVHSATQSLGWGRFFYFVQEYEPFTFPLGTFYRAAEQSYEFPHIPIFSTDFLVDYFRASNAGVFKAANDSQASSPFLVFRNPIVALTSDLDADRTKTLLFYARPQPNAARNMFDFGIAALRMFVRQLGDEAAEWEFIGIGAGTVGEVGLSPDLKLNLIEKLDADRYRQLLGRARLGLALMYTPHPSLIPIEMAAAGLETVTNACFSKQPDSFADISDRIIVASPDVDSISESLHVALDLAKRRPSRVRPIWPASARESFPDAWVRKFRRLALKQAKHQSLSWKEAPSVRS